MTEVFICDAVRTPFGRYGGALSSIRTDDLATLPIKALMERNPAVDWGAVDDGDLRLRQPSRRRQPKRARIGCFRRACRSTVPGAR